LAETEAMPHSHGFGAVLKDSAALKRQAPLKPVELSLEVAENLDALLALRSDYERLQRSCGNSLPFALHDWHVAWCNHFLAAHRRIQSHIFIHVLRNEKGECVAIVPLIRTRRGVGPFRITSLDLLGADPAITEIRSPLIEPGYEASAAWTVQRKLMKQGGYNWIQWHGIAGPFWQTLAAGAELQQQEPLVDYILDLPSTWEAFRASLKRNVRESIRHCYNSLRRDGHEFQLIVATREDEVQTALERFFALHTERANLAGTVKHPDHFQIDVSRRFLRDVTQRLSQRGMVRLFELRIGATVVASRIGFVVGDSLYLYYSGYDPRWSKYSVMTTTVVEAIKYAIAEGLATVNLTPGTDVSKTRWSPRELEFPQAVQVYPSRLSRWAWHLYQRARSPARAAGPLGLFSLHSKRRWR
jgi:CelD/BcsL family acetyltransferase involved in cellulose biosynthesis